MAIRFGEIEAGQILENEYRIGVLEKLLELVMNRNTNALLVPSEAEVTEIRGQVIRGLQEKYPNSGITLGRADE